MFHMRDVGDRWKTSVENKESSSPNRTFNPSSSGGEGADVEGEMVPQNVLLKPGPARASPTGDGVVAELRGGVGLLGGDSSAELQLGRSDQHQEHSSALFFISLAPSFPTR
jgi:hypothetical protein